MNTLHLKETVDRYNIKHYAGAKFGKGSDVARGNDCTLENQLHYASENANLTKKVVSQEFDKWDIDMLCDYILNTLYRNAKEDAIIIYDLIQKAAYKYGEAYPELSKLAAASFLFFKPLLTHLIKKQQMLFPAIREIAKYRSTPKKTINKTIEVINYWVMVMQRENEIAGEEIQLFREFIGLYEFPKDQVNSFNHLLEKMEDFEKNLIQNVHLENNILFPKARMMVGQLWNDDLKVINPDTNAFSPVMVHLYA